MFPYVELIPNAIFLLNRFKIIPPTTVLAIISRTLPFLIDFK